MNKIIMTDGTRSEIIYRVKSVNPFTDERPGVWTSSGVSVSQEAKSNRLVPSVYAGIQARIQAMADMPFTIYSVRGDKELDNSDNYKNVVEILPSPSAFLSLCEGGLVLYGRSYWFKERGAKTGDIKGLKYWIPSSVTLDSESAKKGEIKFRRTGITELYNKEQVLYIWGLDPDVEIGPPSVNPFDSAIIAAEANGAISKWVADYMRRGAVKAMLLMVDGMPPPGEVERIEGWFNRFMSGIRGLTWRVFNGGLVKPTIVGDGLEALKDLSINKELRYEIHQALGTRHLLEDENYATAQARERQFYTQQIVPDSRFIGQALNEQILHAMGYHIEFQPERLEIFQTDEGEQAKAFIDLFNGFRAVMSVEAAFELAAQKLDYQFTDEQLALIKKGIADKNNETKIPEESVQDTEDMPVEAVRALVELNKWEAKVEKAGKMVTWHAIHIPADIAKGIKDGNINFDTARTMVRGDKPKPADAAAVLEGLRLAIEHAKSG